MTVIRAKELIPVLQAYSEGRPFQYKARDTGKWCYWNYSFCSECSFSYDVEYRIPPKAEEPQYRPFEYTAELILHYQQHFNAVCPPYAEPLIWVKNKNDNRYLVTGYDEKCILIEDIWKDMKDLFNDYVFLDGSPCGMKK